MVRKPITISVEEDILKKFRKYCEDNDINMSKRIERYMRTELERKDKK